MNVTPTILHALRHGFPLCGFSRREPKDWPEDNIWVNWKEFDPQGPGATRCPGCIAVADAGKQPAGALVEIDYAGIALDYAKRCAAVQEHLAWVEEFVATQVEARGALAALVVDLLTELHNSEGVIEGEFGGGESSDLGTSWRDAGGDFKDYRDRLAAINLKGGAAQE